VVLAHDDSPDHSSYQASDADQTTTPDRRERFHRNARITARLNALSPHINSILSTSFGIALAASQLDDACALLDHLLD